MTVHGTHLPINANGVVALRLLRSKCLHEMPPTFHVTFLVGEVTELGGDSRIRSEISRLNTIYHIFLQVHKNKDGSLTIWHNPVKPERDKTEAFEKLSKARKELEELQHKQNAHQNSNTFLEEMFAIQQRINAAIEQLKFNPTEPLKRKGGELRQPLRVILEYWKVTAEEWALVPKRKQTRLWIQAEVEIKKRQQEFMKNA